MSKTLYILGNGFDLFHGLPTHYRCLLCYLQTTHPIEEKKIGFLFDRNNPDKLWSNFEKELETFDAFSLVEKNIDSWIKKETYEKFENLFTDIHCTIQTLFKDWVSQIDMETNNGNRIVIEKEAFFLNFNYTNTLEKYYDIDPSQICYIHRDTKNNECANPIVGHSRKNNCVEKVKCRICQFIRAYGKYPNWAQNSDDFAQKVIDELNDLWEGLSKAPQILQYNTNEIYTIAQNEAFFKQYVNLENIYIMGHSMSAVDSDYFKKIYIQSPNAQWHISKYNQTDEELITNLANLIGIEKNNIKIDTFYMDSLLVKNK